MDRRTLILLVAFRHPVRAPDMDAGLARVEALIGRQWEAADQEALSALVRSGHVHDPVRLAEGALQCQWWLEAAPPGVAEIAAFLRQAGPGAEEAAEKGAEALPATRTRSP